MVVTVSEPARGFGHRSQGSRLYPSSTPPRSRSGGPTSGNGSERNRSKLNSGTGPAAGSVPVLLVGPVRCPCSPSAPRSCWSRAASCSASGTPDDRPRGQAGDHGRLEMAPSRIFWPPAGVRVSWASSARAPGESSNPAWCSRYTGSAATSGPGQSRTLGAGANRRGARSARRAWPLARWYRDGGPATGRADSYRTSQPPHDHGLSRGKPPTA